MSIPTTTVAPADRADGAPHPVTTRRRHSVDAIGAAVLAGLVSVIGAPRPSLWFDEAATVSAAYGRPLGELWGLLGNIDAVHGLYYVVMHCWLLLVPPTEFWLRAPSCLAVAVAAAGVVVLARRFAGRPVALCAGAVFAILPRVTWAGIEARPYAMVMAAAVWLVVLVEATLRRPRPGRWLLVPPMLALTVLLNLFGALMVPVLWWLAAVVRARRGAAATLVAVSALTVAAMWPFVALTRGQVGQVNWITPPAFKTVGEVAVAQYFDTSLPFAVTAGALGVGALLTRRRRQQGGDRRSELALFAVGWLVIPTAVMVAYSAVAPPVYYPRYFAFSAPAMALLLGVCIVTVARHRARMVALLLALALLALPGYAVAQRSPYAKEEMDFSAVADVVAAHAAPGDCLLLDNTVDWLPGPIRPLTAARPQAYRALVDPGRGRTAVARDTLWDGHIAVWNIERRVDDCPAVWLVSERDLTVPDRARGASLPPGPRLGAAPAYRTVQRLGFRVTQRWQFSFAQLVEARRDGAAARASE